MVLMVHQEVRVRTRTLQAGNKGFTLIELIIVSTLIVLFLSIVLINTGRIYDSLLLRESSFGVVKIINRARAISMTLMELFQSNLRASKRSEDYTQAIIIGTSEIEKALSTKLEPGDATENIDIYKIERKIQLRSETEGFRVYEITVKVLWDNNLYEISSIKTEEVEEGEE
jgi:prepilin-type N-terminal cleavage/methylation domain-containing protein